MNTPPALHIIRALGADTIARELGLTEFSVRAAKRDRLFPAKWYGPLSALCEASGVECPLDAFRWIDNAPPAASDQFGSTGTVNEP